MAYYSKEVGTIYHKCLGCFAGNNIEVNNMTKGQPPGARLCKICANLNKIGKCTIGIPPGVEHKPQKPKIKTYYSKLQKAIYHNCENCSVGNNMVYGNLRRGKPKPVKGRNGKIKEPRLCKTCEALKNAGTAIFGVPKLPRVKRGAKVKTYYSKKCPQIFHICQNCFLGQNIEEANLVKDKPPVVKDGKEPRLCKVCTKVCITGKCMVGTPIPAKP
jgi:hypothetical protein